MLKSMINPDLSGKHTKLILTFLLFIFLSTNLVAQYVQWVSRYNGTGSGNDSATSIAVDNMGNVYVTGNSAGNGTGTDCVTIKYNSNGDTVWVRRYNGPGNGSDVALSIGVDGSGNVYIAGNSVGSGTGWDYLAIKYNSDGVQQWVQRYNGPENNTDKALSAAIDGMGNVHLTGYSQRSDNWTSYYVTIKYNFAGVLQWVRTASGAPWLRCKARSIALDNSGNVYVTGDTGNDTSVIVWSDWLTIKYNPGGGTLWSVIQDGPYSYNSEDYAYSVGVASSGYVYVSGHCDEWEWPFAHYDVTLAYGAGAYDWSLLVKSFAADNLGNMYVITSSSTEKIRAYYPGPIWSKPFGGTCNAIALDSSDNVYVTGLRSGDYGTIKYNSAGVQQWVHGYNGPGNGIDGASSIAVDNLGNVYVTGSSPGIGTGKDFATIKYLKIPPHIPFAPSLVTPSNNAVGQELNLSLVWNSVEFTDKYRVQLSLDNSFFNIILDDSTLTDTIKVAINLSPLTDYYWRVSAKNILGSGPFSSVWHFKTKGAPTQVNLLYPPNNSINIPVDVNFIWSRPGEQTYSISTLKNIYKENRVISKYWFELTSDTSGTPLIIDSTLSDTTKFVSNLNSFTSYYWHVKAKNEIGWSIYSPWFKFTTVLLAPEAPELVYPENYATLVELNPLLDWDSSATAESYRAKISEDLLFINVVYDSSNIAITEYQLPNNGLEINTTYYWRVNATNVTGTSPWSEIFEFTTGTTNISGNNEIPKEFKLYENYPNPFNPSTKIKFDIPKSSYVKLIVYDVLGREIKTLVNEKLNAGMYEVDWPAPSGDGSSYPSGVYFYKLITDDYISVKKMLMIK